VGEGTLDLSLQELRYANVARAEKWHDGAEPWSLADWSNALAGEVGEACNVVKKIRRLETGTPKSRPDERDRHRLVSMLAGELADTMIYLDLLAHAAGVDLGCAVRDKFNHTSEAFGFEDRL
jgi:NTP pyrophosphatase (non-canonical NTP hydrolase)